MRTRCPQCVPLLILGIGALGGLGLMPASVVAQGEPIGLHLLSPTLGSEHVRARTLSGSGVVVLDALDIPHLRGWDTVVVALREDHAGFVTDEAMAPGRELVGWAVLADGQRHRVWPNPPASANPDVLEVTLADGTEWSIPLEILRALVFWEGEDQAGPTGDDTVRLGNGDAITGFVESIGDTVIVDSTRVPLDRVLSISLANPSVPAEVMLIDLADGSVIGAGELSPTDHGRVSIELLLPGRDEQTSTPRITVERDEILAIRPAHSSSRVIPLSSITPERVSPLGGRRWAPAPEVSSARAPGGLRPIVFPGPMETVYPLPSGAAWFRAEPTLGPGEWSEVEIEVLIERPGGVRETIASCSLSRDSESSVLHAPLPPDALRLVIRIGAGARGPVQDRVELRWGAIVTEH